MRTLSANRFGTAFLLTLGVGLGTATAATITVTGVQTGTPGLPGTGTPDPNNPNEYNGNFGNPGYAAGNGTDSYVFNNAIATGGTGGIVTAADTNPDHSYSGGTGGYGVSVFGSAATSPVATFNGGVYTGGVGGTATGTAGNALNGGYGGDGVIGLDSSVVINGGTFVGGNSGTAAGVAPNLGSGFAGSGANANNGSSLVINNGTFVGGNGTAVPGGGTGAAGAGLIGLGGDVQIYGGAFTSGTGSSAGYDLDLYLGTFTLYGTDFAVNGVPVTGNTISGSGTLTGRLLNNTTASSLTFINRDFGGTIFLSGTPEPAGLGLLAVGGLGLLRRRR